MKSIAPLCVNNSRLWMAQWSTAKRYFTGNLDALLML